MSTTQSIRLATRRCQCRILPRASTHSGARRRYLSSGTSLQAEKPRNDSNSAPIPRTAKALEHVKAPGRPPIQIPEEDLLTRAIERTSQRLAAESPSNKAMEFDEINPEKSLTGFKSTLFNEDAVDAMIERNEHRLRMTRPDIEDFRDPNLTRGLKPKQGLLNMGESAKDDPMEDPEFEEDDISTLAHRELEQHREFREYARLAAWEMPMLTNMAKPFEAPNKNQVLRFRYTTYMGEQHPAEKKVVVEFCPGDIPDLTDVQREKLKKLAGVRWNPETDIIKMSSEMFESQAQNKRYLGDLVDVLVKEAKDPTDTFEDVPLDTRHHPIRIKPKFPIQWRMTKERKELLDSEREKARLLTEEKAAHGVIIDGVKQIEGVHAAMERVRRAQLRAAPVMATVGKDVKGKRLAIRR